jgi:4-hydroxy-tetrahydrodipicolinate synthase
MSNALRNGGGWQWERALHGIVPPLISPLDDAGTPDAGALAALVEHVVGAGCTGLFMLGGCGEGAWLTSAQRGAVVRHAVRAAAGRVPVLAGVMLPATGPAVEAARQAIDEGADALVVGSPYYFGVEPAAQVRHVSQVLGATSGPVLLYNIPQCTHHVLPPGTVRELAHDPRVVGIKDSAGDFEAFQAFLAIKHERPAFRVLRATRRSRRRACCRAATAWCRAWRTWCPASSWRSRRRPTGAPRSNAPPSSSALPAWPRSNRQGPWLAALKAACAMRGIGNGRPAPPLLPAAPADQEAVRALLREAGALDPAPAGSGR